MLFEKMDKLGGRTASTVFRNHILDNGFHIMPFYKTSAVYQVLEKVGITSRLKLALVSNISFFNNKKFFKSPKITKKILSLDIFSQFNSSIILLQICPVRYVRPRTLKI